MGSWNPFDTSSASSGIQQAGTNLQQGTAVPSQVSSQTQQGENIDQYLAQLFGQQVGQPGASAQNIGAEQQYQNQGPAASALYGQVLNQAQNPTQGWQSTLQPQLQQAQNQINEYYNARGLDNSGIAIGAMGEAGVDLAIQNAQSEMQYQQQSLQNASQLVNQAGAVGQQNVNNLYGLQGQQQQVGLNYQKLADQGLEQSSGYQAYPYQAELGNIYGTEQGLISGGAQVAAAAAMGCWVAAEVLPGGWFGPQTVLARKWVNYKSPIWFRNLYFRYGKEIASFIHNKPLLKNMIRPLFIKFSQWGEE
jgi:hypothetical protein